MITNLFLALLRFAVRWTLVSVQIYLFGIEAFNRVYLFLLAKLSPSGLIQVAFPTGALAGKKFWLDYRKEKFLWLEPYEPELQIAIKENVNPGMIAYDVGANFGLISIVLALAVGSAGQVFAFEPLPANMDRLQANLKTNPELANVEFIPKAVTDNSAPTRFLVHESFAMGKVQGSLGSQESYFDHITVSSVSLDEFVYFQKHPIPQAIKLDVEGGEILVMKGMPRLLSEAKPIFFIETHGELALENCREILTNASYTFHELAIGYPITKMDTTSEYIRRFLARPPA
ncbi:MAG: FkbM family methyltransferase [Chloroflexi bacterium]|nr:FkbM family methyltransferase [Chloroflexota bacterium]